MKYITLALAACVGLSAAGPLERRQDIDFAAYDAIPVLPDVAAPAGDAEAAAATYVATSVAAAAASAVTSEIVATGTAAAVSRREAAALGKRAACDARTPGYGPTVTTPDDSSDSFLAYSGFSSVASAAPTVVGYNRVATNAQGSAQDSTYLTYKMLTSYDVAGCAAFCQGIQGCNSFNVFYERDPVVEPGTGCDNPASLTYIKCSVFGGILTASSLQNVGQWQDNFHVVIAGSDLYVATAPADPSGFTGPLAFSNGAVNAPSGYMGVQTFPQSQPYDPSVCATACNTKSAYDIKHGLPSASNPDICNFFVAYILYKNGGNGVFTCTYYTQAWDSTYATNTGQWDSAGNHYTVGYSNGFYVNGATLNSKNVVA